MRLTPSFSKCCIEKKESNTVCSSINWPSNFVKNVLLSKGLLTRFQHKVTFKNLKLKLMSFPDFVAKSSEHCWREFFFFTRWWELEEELFWRFKHFSKLKTVVCEYWTSIKIKISMTCVPTEYDKNGTVDYNKKWHFYWVITY